MSYRFMRMMIFFDLPTDTIKDRREYARFRKYLIKSGFVMMQESVYCKLILNQSAVRPAADGIRKNRPLPIGNGRFFYCIQLAFCRRLRLSSTTAESTHTQPSALSGVSFSWNTKMPTSVATTGSNDARMDALPVSSPVRPKV